MQTAAKNDALKACLAMGAALPDSAVEALLDRLTHDDSGVRWSAAWALSGRPGEKVTTALLDRLIHDDDSWVRGFAARALSGRPGEKVTTALLDRLIHDDDSWVRRSAAQALSGRPGKEVSTALLELTHDDDSEVRRSAAQALSGRPGEEVSTALLDRLPRRRDSGEQVKVEYTQEEWTTWITRLYEAAPLIAASLSRRPQLERSSILRALTELTAHACSTSSVR